MKIIKCDCGQKAIVIEVDCSDEILFAVECNNTGCWSGPAKSTQQEAVVVWNSIMK